MNVVKLEVLALANMKHAIRVFLGHFRKCIELVRRHASERNLDTLHTRRVPKGFGPLGRVAQVWKLLGTNAVMPMPIVITLAVTPPAEACLRKNLFVQLALPAQRHLRLENIDLFG